MSYVFLTLGFFAFLLAARSFRVVGQVTEAMRQFRRGIAVMAVPDLSDDAKEQALQRAALRTGGLFLRILLACLAATAVAAVCLLAGNAFGLYDLRDVAAAGLNPVFLLVLVALGVASFRLIR
jgi:hypothetical protein